MGIRDRDYMKRQPDDDGERSSPADDKVEAALGGFLARHPRFFVYIGIGLLVLVLAAFIVALVSGKGR